MEFAGVAESGVAPRGTAWLRTTNWPAKPYSSAPRAFSRSVLEPRRSSQSTPCEISMIRIPARSSMPCNVKGLHTHSGHAYSVWLLSCSLEPSRCRHVPEGLDVLAATCSALNFAVLALALLYKRCQHRARSRTSAERREVAQLERVSTAGTREPGQSTGSSEFALLERSSFSRDGTRERVLAAGAEEAGYGQAKGCVVKLAQFPRPSCR